MYNKLSLIFVVVLASVLAVSFVHSLPNLGEVDEDQLGPLVALIQRLNTTSPKSKDNDESGEQDLGDLIYSTFFEDEDVPTDVETNPDYAFGPELNFASFMVRLDYDIEKAHQRKCKKISGKDETYGNVKTATKELGICLRNWSKSEGIRSDFSKSKSFDDYKSLFNKVCRKRDVPMKCLETYVSVDVQCSFPSEIEIENSIYRIIRNTLNLVCANDGNDFISLFFGQGRQCLIENLNEGKICSNKATYAIIKGLFVKLIEYETFDYKMNADECKDFDESKSCYVSVVENCVDPIPKKFFSSMFQIIRNETECAKIAPLQTNLLK